MKLVKGHDYYDGAGGGVDESIVFVRTPQTFTETPFELPLPTDPRHIKTGIDFFALIIAGEFFPGIVEQVRGGTNLRRDFYGNLVGEAGCRACHFEAEAALAALARLQEKGYLRGRGLRDLGATIADHFARAVTPDQAQWLITNQVVVGRLAWDLQERRAAPILVANAADLGAHEAYRVMDPATAHMRIANYVGGVLPGEREIVEPGDRDRLAMAGFDTETSFRMPKGAKKPRRAKKQG